MTLALPSRRAVLLPGAWARNDLWRRARAVPSLDLRFAENKSLVDAVTGQNLVTFSRTSSATYWNSSGTLQTAAVNAPRFDHNPITGESLGLLIEEQRINLLLNSGTLSTQSVTVAATQYTLSFYGTGTVTLSGTSTAGPLVGTDSKNRASLTFTPTAGTLTLTVSGSVQYANLEAGAYATSWIPTAGSSATRSSDIASITGAAFSSWYRQDALSSYAEFAYTPQLVQQYLFSINDGGASNRIGVYATNGPCAMSRNTAGAGVSASPQTPNNTVTGKNKIASASTSGDHALTLNGGAIARASNYALPAANQMNIGNQLGTGYANFPIARLTLWPWRLPNSALQEMTR